MKTFKEIILNNLNNIEWLYEKNENDEYDPKANYKGSTHEIDNVFHVAFADSLIEWRDERVKNWVNWVTIGTLTTPVGVTTPFTGTSSCGNLVNPMDSNLSYTMREAFRMLDPNMKFSHTKVFQAIHDWLASSIVTVYVDGSLNLAMNMIPFIPDAFLLSTYSVTMEGELFIESQEEGFEKENYWDIFGKYLDLAVSSSVQTPIVMGGVFNGNALNATCQAVL